MENVEPAPSSAPKKLRRWPVALLVGLITAIVGACAIAPIADWITNMHHVSNMEGGRGCLIIVVWIPLATICGFIIGFVTTLLVRQNGFVGYIIPQAIALGIGVVLLGVVAGIGYATADHPPLIDNRELALDIEVKMPANGQTIESMKAHDFSIALTVSASDRSYADLRWQDASESNDTIVIRAWAALRSRNAGREITAGYPDDSRQVFIVMLPSSPRKIDDDWSDWQPPQARFNGSKPSPNEQYLVRYRVRFADEYSPTPVEAPSETPEPSAEESPSATPDPQGMGTKRNDNLDRGLIPPSPSPDESPRPSSLTR